MSNVKIQAREIVRYARRNKLVLGRGEIGSGKHHCARSAVLHMFLGDSIVDGITKWTLYKEHSEIPLTDHQLNSLEYGFENIGWSPRYNKTYYKMGKRVAELVGL